MSKKGRQQEALWHCGNCGVWWCSQPEVNPTRFMLEMPGRTLEALGWENFRGWRLGGTPHVATCPECSTVSTEPAVGAASAGQQLQLDLTALLRPVLAPPPLPTAHATQPRTQTTTTTPPEIAPAANEYTKIVGRPST